MPHWLTEPLVPPSPTVERMAQPGLQDTPAWARIKGFGSGALEGLRQQTSPLNLGAAAVSALPMGAMLQGLRGASQIGRIPGVARGLARITPDLVEAAPVARQVMPAAEDVSALMGQMRYNMAKIPRPGAGPTQMRPNPPMDPRNLPMEMVPRGGEAGYNAIRTTPRPPVNPMQEDVFHRAVQGPQQTPFRRLQDEGVFRGERTTGQFPEGPGGLSDALRVLIARGRR